MPSINPQRAPLYPMMQMSPAVSYSTPEAYARLDQILADIGFKIVGSSPYMQLRFSQKALDKMQATQEAGQQSKSKKTRNARDFKDDWEEAL